MRELDTKMQIGKLRSVPWLDSPCFESKQAEPRVSSR